MRLAVMAATLLVALPSAAAPLDQAALEAELHALQREHRRFIQLEELARSHDGRAVHRLELGVGSERERAARPALLVVAGTEQHDLIGTAAVLALARELTEAQADGTGLLDRVTVHLVPRLSADAAATAFERPRRSSPLSSRPVDDDHDGLSDEDGPDDLNGDGLITWMRIEDPEGSWVLDPDEPRLLREPDRTKGERPAWRYLPEGIDDDGDERWNEDGPGGVNLDRNFPFGYEFFAGDAGLHQVSEPAARALADLLVANPNIGIVVAYGAADNVAGAPKPGKKREGPPKRFGRKPVVKMDPGDHAWLERIGEEYREAVGISKAIDAEIRPGSLADWAYFHRGRLGLAVAPWRPAVIAGLEKPGKEEDGDEAKESGDDSPAEPPANADSPQSQPARVEAGDTKQPDGRTNRKKKDAPGADERAFLKWLDESHPAAFVPWEAVDHPDFPGRRVEVGGFAPFAKLHPPPELADELIEQHAGWLAGLATKLPRVGILRAEAKALGRGVFEIEVVVENEGWLPTVLAHGESTRLVHPTRVEIDLPEEAVLAGDRSARIGPLDGSGGRETVRFVVHAPGRKDVRVSVTSALGGQTETRVSLRRGQR